ncbi:hypothetical protein OUZ56_031538 [Daphnia magna]|uniref:Uncharacterized protein n=1 Tax=Daphnia magna TaxID=35525 RepID=A0ABQ9ZUH5_9CRUS|nr:hypothetical protein OUZ56_031538 [Daphnia magna]
MNDPFTVHTNHLSLGYPTWASQRRCRSTSVIVFGASRIMACRQHFRRDNRDNSKQDEPLPFFGCIKRSVQSEAIVMTPANLHL